MAKSKKKGGLSRLTSITVKPVELVDTDGTKFTVYVRKIAYRHARSIQDSMDAAGEVGEDEKWSQIIDLILRYSLCEESGELCYGPDGEIDYDTLDIVHVQQIVAAAGVGTGAAKKA